MNTTDTIETTEMFDENIIDAEEYLAKDRSRADKRKKTFMKGKNRFNRVCQKGFTPPRSKESVIRGMFRKTNVVRVYCSSDDTRQKGFNHSAIRRKNKSDYAINDYYKEDI